MEYSIMVESKNENDAKSRVLKTFKDAVITKVMPTAVRHNDLPMFWVTFKSREAKKWS